VRQIDHPIDVIETTVQLHEDIAKTSFCSRLPPPMA